MMMNIADSDLFSMADQKSKAEYKANHMQKDTYRTKESQGHKSFVPRPIEHLAFEDDKYPSDHFGLFDSILGIISLVVLFILFW
ncbi:MAG: hypothetical protein ACI9N9_002037 [Enterobacterales bacterium]|jgi:hypothetical protein